MVLAVIGGRSRIPQYGPTKTAVIHRVLVKVYMCAATDGLNGIGMFLIEYLKPETDVITLPNHKEHRQSSEPIKTQNKYLQATKSADKRVRANQDWLLFHF